MWVATAVAWILISAGYATIGVALWTDRIPIAAAPRLGVALLGTLVLGAALTQAWPERLRRASACLREPHTWPAAAIAGLLAGGTLATLGAIAGAGVVVARSGASVTAAVLADPVVRGGAVTGTRTALALAAPIGLLVTGQAIRQTIRSDSPRVDVALAGLLATALAVPGGRVTLGAAIVIGVVGLGLVARPTVARLVAPLGVTILPPRSEWAHGDAEGERAHRRAQRRDPPVAIGESVTIVIQERLGPEEVRGVYESFQVFVQWEVPADLVVGDRICVRIEDYGTNDAGQRTSGQARYRSRGACD